MNLEGDSTTQGVPGVKGTNSVAGNGIFGDSTLGDAVVGFAHASGKAGVLGLSPDGNAVAGISDNGTGVFGQGTAFGVVGTSTTGEGVHAHSDSGNAVHGDSGQSDAVVGLALASGKAGVLGLSPNGNAVVGISDNGTGVFGQGGLLAGSFVGPVLVQGNLQVIGDIFLPGADCAEQFDIAGPEQLEPGAVVVIGSDGSVRLGREAYDKKVAGVISGAGEHRPGIVLDKKGSSGDGRASVALVGKVYCKVDAGYSPIGVGDLLTTSLTPGHAMRASDPFQAFGAVIGKALRPWTEGCGLIPILIALQ
ncbi:MAG: hypothetical protein WBW33_22860 [Bryobacteraceae bacterium]